jgi:hypothetical protein
MAKPELTLIKPDAKALATLFEYLAGRKPTEAEKAEAFDEARRSR